MSKELYLNLMDTVLDAYSPEQIRLYIDDVIKNSITEHGFPRLTANLGILIAHGRKTELRDLFLEMMDLCCSEIPVCHEKNGFVTGNDFSVKEIVFCILELEKVKIFPENITEKWRSELAKIEPQKVYSVIAEVPPKRINNWAAFGAASEQIRKYAGIGDESDFIENQIKSQLFSFDENGMYRDPNEPMVYDMVTRLQLAAALYFGYDGESREELEDNLMKSADITLKMQSVTGEIPYGGRSNQFLHNETFYAALCEFYASQFRKKGDLNKAGLFKKAARVAAQSIIPWLNDEKKTHIKNYYATDSLYGCEDYAYYKKYMVTTASWLYLAYAMSEDIEESEEIQNNYVCETTEYFHKVFIKHGDYFAEFDTQADEHYDATGLGRIHKKGVPSALCLSVPFSVHPNYIINSENNSPFSICGGIKTDSGYVYSWDSCTKYKLINKKRSNDSAYVEFVCISDNQILFSEKYIINDNGVEMIVEGSGELEIMIPVFHFDGRDKTEIDCHKGILSVTYKGHSCEYVSENGFVNMNCIYENRNGEYFAYKISGKDRVGLNISLK